MLVHLLEGTEGGLGGDDREAEERQVMLVAHSPILARLWDDFSEAVPMKPPGYLAPVVTWKPKCSKAEVVKVCLSALDHRRLQDQD